MRAPTETAAAAPARPGASASVCRIPEAALSCVGCCLYAFAGAEATLASVRRNTAELARLLPGDEAAWLRFRDREAPHDVVCCNCVEDASGLLGCALHPAQLASRDLRRGHCMTEFLCRAAGLWQRAWDRETRERFVAFVRSRRLDSYEYSRQMVCDELLEAFLGQACALDAPSPGAGA